MRVNGTNLCVSVSGQVGGMDPEDVAGEWLKLSSGKREAVERGNNTPGSVDPDGEVGQGSISPDPRPGLRPSSPCRS
jgi:hypothetical protein